MKKIIKRLLVLLGVTVLALTMFLWDKYDVSLRVSLIQQGASPQNMEIHLREQWQNGQELVLVRCYSEQTKKPVLVALLRNGCGAWMNCAMSYPNLCQIFYAGNGEENSIYYGENAVAPVYFKDGQISDGLTVKITQNENQYYVHIKGSSNLKRPDIAKLLTENGCIQ